MLQNKTMKEAIEFLRNLGLTVTDSGLITSELQEGEEGLALSDALWYETGFSININQLENEED